MTIAAVATADPREAQPVSDKVSSFREACRHDPSLEMVVESLQSLRPAQLAEVWKFIQFLDYKDFLEDPTEDEWAWRMVQESQRYDQEHPDEPLLRFQSGEEFLRATETL